MTGTKPLDGVRVIELAQLTSGPFAATIMAEQGAEVIKVEPRAFGDLFRLTRFQRGGHSALMLNHGHGKRSIALDSSTDAGREIVLDLIAGADVVIQNFRPGVVDRIGLGYEAARERNPSVIYVSVSGYGPDGPYAKRPIVDPIIQGLVGMVARQQSEAIPIPDLVRHIVIDKATGLTVAQAVCAALYRREKSGTGDHLVIPMLDVGMHFFWPDGMMDHTLVGDGVAGGVRISDTYQLTQCADGLIIYYCPNPAMIPRLFDVLGHPEWGEDPRFATLEALLLPENFEAFGAVTQAEFAKFAVGDILERLHAAEIPAGPILDAEDVFVDPQVVHNGTLVTWEHPEAGMIRQPRHPVRFASAETPIPQSSPSLGEHTDAILTEIGRSADEIGALRDAGVIT